LPRHLALSRLALAAALAAAAAAAGCSGAGDAFENVKDAKWFVMPKLDTPDWAKAGGGVSKAMTLGPSGPVAPEELVDAAGHCGPETARAQAPAEAAPAPAPAEAPAAPATPPANPAYGSLAGDLASAPMPQGPPPAPMPVSVKPSDRLEALQPEISGGALAGGIALGMTECQAVRRAGAPGNVSIGAGDKGVRKVVVTYLGGPWPGIYTFDSGRLKVVDAAPVQEKPKPAPKQQRKKKPAPKTATTERVYVQ
jgi:hypothetical protein